MLLEARRRPPRRTIKIQECLVSDCLRSPLALAQSEHHHDRAIDWCEEKGEGIIPQGR